MEKPEVRIENWQIINDQLHGQVYGHPRFQDGEWVVTSLIDHVETRNTRYKLGEPLPLKGD